MPRLEIVIALLLSLVATGLEAVKLCSNVPMNNFARPHKDDDGSTVRRVIGAAPDYTFDCCGILARVEAERQSDGSGFDFEIWRPTSTQNEYHLIWKLPITPGRNVRMNIPGSASVTVHRGDVIGWYATGKSEIEYDDNEKRYDVYIMDGSATMSPGSTVTTTSAQISPEYKYYMNAWADEGNDPTLTSTIGPSISMAKSAAPADTTIFTLIPSDIDVGQNVSLVLTKISGVLVLSGRILKTQSVLEKGTYLTVVKVEDECTRSSSATFTLIVTNTPPTFTNLPTTVTVDEDVSVQTSLFTISTNDGDADTVVCDFALGTSTSVSNIFQIRTAPSTTGPFLLYVRANPALDFDTTPAYSISVTCTDGEAPITETITVNVVANTPPTFNNLPGSENISSGQSTGSTIFTVKATDAQSDQMNYTMTCTPSNPFNIYPSGAVILSQSILGSTTASYSCSVTVHDHRGSTGPTNLAIYVSDLKTKPVLVSLPTTVSVDENSAGGTLVYTFNISDADGDTSFSYQLSIVPNSGSVKFVTIDSTNKLILAVGQSLDYESDPKSYSVAVTAFDGLLTSDSKVLTITVNDVNETPVLDDRVVSYFITNRENGAGTVLPNPGYQFTDPDAGDTHTYSLVGGVNSSVLTVNSATGLISFATNYDVDQNYLPEVIVPLIEIRDSGGLAVTATVTVSVWDYNDNAPTFPESSYVTSVLKYASVDTRVFSLAATDRDSGTNAQIKYSLTQATGLDQDYFAVNDEGQVYVLRSGSDLTVTSVTVTVTATDQGSPQLSGSYKLTILLLTVTKGFLSYPGNVAWLSAVCVLGGAAAILFGGFLLYGRMNGGNILDSFREWYRKQKARRIAEQERHREMRRREKEERRYQEDTQRHQDEIRRRPVSPHRASYRSPASNPTQNNGNPYDVVRHNTNYEATRLGGHGAKLNNGTGPSTGSYEFWNANGTYKF